MNYKTKKVSVPNIKWQINFFYRGDTLVNVLKLVLGFYYRSNRLTVKS